MLVNSGHDVTGLDTNFFYDCNLIKDKFDIELNSISKSTKEKIEKVGGKVTLIK